jgi:hypothetical protein
VEIHFADALTATINVIMYAEFDNVIEILTSVLTIQSSISQFEFLFEQLSTIKLFQCFHIQMVAVPFLRNNPSDPFKLR